MDSSFVENNPDYQQFLITYQKNMIAQSIKKNVIQALEEIEATENVRIFWACESGSRAWGFPSTDSDYDVRFLYIHPTDWYLSIDDPKDVIEKPGEILDLSGWEIRKALKLLRKSNPPLLEWLQSPIVYLEQYSIAQKFRDLIPEYYAANACLYHYLSMAHGNFREYLKGENVWTKKYFYVLRPILACLWIEKNPGPVPMQFEELVKHTIVSEKLKNEIEILLVRKKSGEELSWGARNPIINHFIENEISRLETITFTDKRRKPGNSRLNELFREALVEVWR